MSADGKRKTVEASQIEIAFGGGRRVILDFPGRAWGDLDILAESTSGTPLLSLQPGACNLLTLRVDARHDVIAAQGAHLESPFRLEMSVQKAVSHKLAAALPKKKQLLHWARAALEGDARVTVRFVDEEEGATLNQRYRQKDGPTNVLTFSYTVPAGASVFSQIEDDDPVLPAETVLCGDIVFCAPVVAKEAQAQGKTLEAHYAHLIIHAMLHLQGFDHESEADARTMEGRERMLMALLGFRDPYKEIPA